MNRLHYFVAFIGFTVLSAIMLFTHLFPIHLLTPFYGDYGQMVWNLWSVCESIWNGQNPYFSDLIFYPTGSLLAKHTLAMGFFPITMLVKFITNNSSIYPFISFKIIILLSFTLLCFFTYLTIKELNYTKFEAIIPAIGYGFCNFYMLHWMHLNHISGFFISLTAWLLIRLCKQPSFRRALSFCIALGVSIYFTEFFLFIILSLLFYLSIVLVVRKSDQKAHIKTILSQIGLSRIFFCMIVFVSIIAPFLINFLNHETLPPSRESISVFSANAFSILIPSPDTTPAYGKIFAYLNDRISQGVSGKESFVGFPLLLFAIVGFIYRRHTYQTFLGLTTIVFYILSLGPTLKIFSLETFFPLPYALLSYVPVFQAFRTPARFVVISYFCIALLSAEGIKKVSSTLKAHFSTRSAYIVKTLILLWTLIEVYSPIPALPILPVPNFPPLRSGPVLNVPIDINDGYALALQIFHKHPIALGNLARFNLQQIQRAEILNRWLTNSDQKLCENLRKDNYSMIILVSPVEDKKVEFLSTCKIPILESYQSFIWRI